MTGKRLFGVETEYAMSAFNRAGRQRPFGDATEWLMNAARRDLPHLPAHNGSGIFLQNAARLYIDQGHPEFSTPEVVSPDDACRYVLAGHKILASVARRVVAKNRSFGELFITRCNVCYGPEASTWGCHESYAHQADQAKLAQQIIPHLVSRLIYCGAGGFNNRHSGLEFMLSPRVAHLETVYSEASMRDRGIYHQKNEPLSNGLSRLHLLCGESLCSHRAMWLKVAITALVVAAIEAGLNPCSQIRLSDPLGAIGVFARDTTCTARAECTDGKQRTAIQMQRSILEQLERRLKHPVMPQWAPEACERLGLILDRLEEGPEAVAHTLDWGIKLSLYREVARRQGIAWESLDQWNRQEAYAEPRTIPVLRATATAGERMRYLVLELGSHPPDRTEPTPMTTLRGALLELDTRFGQLGGNGIFDALSESGVLDHGLPGVTNIDQAVTEPPSTGRARIRGDSVRKLQGPNNSVECDWTAVWDSANRRYLDLSDPFASSADWKEISESDLEEDTGGCHVCFDVESLLEAGRVDEASALLQRVFRSNLRNGDSCLERLRDLQAMVGRTETGRPAELGAT